MATQTKAQKAEAEAEEAAAEATPTGMLPQMEVEEDFNLPLRGKGFNQEVIFVRDQLIQCKEEGTVRSFKDIKAEDKEKFARLIRKAGEMADIKPATRHDKATNKLYWGPEEVMKNLSQKSR